MALRHYQRCCWTPPLQERRETTQREKMELGHSQRCCCRWESELLLQERMNPLVWGRRNQLVRVRMEYLLGWLGWRSQWISPICLTLGTALVGAIEPWARMEFLLGWLGWRLHWVGTALVGGIEPWAAARVQQRLQQM